MRRSHGLRPVRTVIGALSALAVIAALVVTSAAPAGATQSARPTKPAPGVYEFTLTRVSNARPVTVVWGDGTSSRKRSTCSPARVGQRPQSCTLRFTHRYSAKGDYTITVKWGSRVIKRQTIHAPFAPTGWRPPKGWQQPAGWNPYPGGATFASCAVVPWYYDATAQPAGSAGMRADVVAGLALLGQQTGLRFVETADRAAAHLVFGWADVSATYGSDVGGIGGRDSDSAYVRFSTTNWWPADTWAGFERVTLPDGRWAIGRGWLVVHETMHALGFDHVADESAVMNPTVNVSALSPGDLAGLQTMYPSASCK